MKNVNQVNLYEMQDDFKELCDLFAQQMDVDKGVMCDLCLDYVRNLVVENVC